MSNISEIELNQLRLLQLIFETKNLTRAGERAGLTQSAVSHVLKKLRHSFNDSLVIRQGNKLELTPRAEALKGPLNRWLNDFERNILRQEEFDPLSSTRTFYIATSDMVEQIIAAPLAQKLCQQAPGINLIFTKLDKRGFANQIENGEVDFSISVMDSSHPSLMVTTLFRDDFVSVARQDHPIFASEMTIERFCYFPHVLAGTGKDNKGSVDRALETRGFSRDVKFKVANFSSAPYLVESGDSIFTAPRKFIAAINDKFNIREFETPVQLDDYAMKLYWHIKNKDDQANSWLRNLIQGTVRGNN